MTLALEVKNLTKIYQSGSSRLTVLENISFSLSQGKTCAIIGPSGSGKTTLMGLCAGLDQPSSGDVFLHGVRLTSLSEDELAQIRNRYVGFVFQNFQLIPTLTALENVMVPAELQSKPSPRNQARQLLEKVGLGDRLTHYPVQLSGGEQQRVALARAFINQPSILFADEPTGNLDDETSHEIESLLFELNQQAGTTLVIVTHDMELARKTSQIMRIRGGRLMDEENYANGSGSANVLSDLA